MAGPRVAYPSVVKRACSACDDDALEAPELPLLLAHMHSKTRGRDASACGGSLGDASEFKRRKRFDTRRVREYSLLGSGVDPFHQRHERNEQVQCGKILPRWQRKARRPIGPRIFSSEQPPLPSVPTHPIWPTLDLGTMPDQSDGIYLDYAATTPADPKVASKMADLLTKGGRFGNPHSTSHRFGLDAARAVEDARSDVARLIGASDDEIVWTSGATEAINLALKGVMLSPRARGPHLLVSALEHKAVMETAEWLSGRGVDVELLQPDVRGLITPSLVQARLRSDTGLVSVMHVNNEVGTVTDIAGVARVVRSHGALLHIDASQSAARLPIDVSDIGADLLSLSGHKIYGPKGVGALFVRRAIRPLLEPQTHGGGQEDGLRPGTIPTHQVVGLGVAARLARERLGSDTAHILMLDQRLIRWIEQIDGATLNGNQLDRVQGIVSVRFQDVEAESLMLALGDIAVSAGSACTTTRVEPSHVLLALGLSEIEALSSIRVSLGRHTTTIEIDEVGRRLTEAVTALRSIAA